ncbi:hypothetical protein JKG47_10485 [Acidithiobacillus sp. MC6.1]|nr:hypothetical protein [Acidithiobacillus sp. MC6.1]
MQRTFSTQQQPLFDLSNQDADIFRQQHFSQWVFTGPTGYCQSLSGWSFFGFLQREPDIACIAATDYGDFYCSRVPQHVLGQVLFRRLGLVNPLPNESALMRLLDLSAMDTDFFFTFPYRHIPSGIEIFDDEDVCILVAQMTGSSWPDAYENDLTEALYRWMEADILKFLRDEIICPNVGEYAFLRSAKESETRTQRMHTLLHNPGIVPRTFPVHL